MRTKRTCFSDLHQMSVVVVSLNEQVSSDDHQISLAGGRALGVPCLMSMGARPGMPCLMSRGASGGLYSEVQCITYNGHMGDPLPQWTSESEWTSETRVHSSRMRTACSLTIGGGLPGGCVCPGGVCPCDL